MSDLTIFGQRIKQLRQKAGLSQRDFAEKIGVTASALSAYEKGGKNPSVNVAINIASEFQVSMDWLCGLTSDAGWNKKYCEVKNALEYLWAFSDAGLLKLQVLTDGTSEWATDATLSRAISDLLLVHIQMSQLLATNQITKVSYDAVHSSVLSSCTEAVVEDLEDFERSMQEE